MQATENRLIQGKIGPELLRFALPFMLASFLQSVYGAVDVFVVGQYTDSAAVSAVSIGSQLMMLVTCFVQGISVGGTVLIGRRIGEENPKGTARAVGNLCMQFLLLAVLATPAMLLLTKPLIGWMQTPSEAVKPAETYLLICSAGLPFIIGYNAVSSIYRGIGDSRTPVVFIGIACAVNVALDFAFVGGLHMGTAGAALATVIAQGISFLCGLVHMVRRGFPFPFTRRDFAMRKAEQKAILTVGLPLAFQDVLVHFSFLTISAIINTLGLVASAAVGVAEKLMGFAFIPPGSFSSAVSTMAAQNIGAAKPERAKTSMYYGMFFSMCFGLVVCVLCNTIPQSLIAIFSGDEQVIAAGADYIRTYAIDCALVSFVFNFNAYLNANSRATVCFLHSIGATFLVRIPVTYLMSRIGNGNLVLMGLAAPAASLFSIAICVWYVRRMDKRETNRGGAAPTPPAGA